MAMQVHEDMRRSQAAWTARLPGPLLTLLIVCVILCLALVVTIPMPIGPMYWDHFIYLDAAKRIFDGQAPSIDFFTPAGALGYYLFAGVISVFQNGSPLLIASWSLMVVSAPLMALVLFDVRKRSVPLAFALLVPFLFLSILPFNTEEAYPFPGSDGFGVYNRQICQLLYVLASALVFCRGVWILTVVTALTMLALAFVKITGLAAGIILCFMAFAAGRLPLRAAVAAGVGFFGAIALLEILTGTVSAYAADIFTLLEMNDTSLLPRMVQAASINFGTVFSCGLLILALVVTGREEISAAIGAFTAHPSAERLMRLFDQPFLWLSAFLFAGLVFESQNTGSQALTFLWPLLLHLVLEAYERRGPTRPFVLIAMLALAASLPPATVIFQKAARAWIGTVLSEPLRNSNLKSLGKVEARRVNIERSERLQHLYVEHRDTYEAIAASGELPAFLQYSDFDFQISLLQDIDAVIPAIKAYEMAHGTRFETIMTLDFTNPLPWLMDRSAPKYITIGADPYRAVPPITERMRKAVEDVDLALYPTCPPTTARAKLYSIYEPALTPGHTRVTLTPCYDAFVRSDLLKTN